MTSSNKGNVILAAGGTGGHLYPAEALAAELLIRGYNITIITDKRGNAFKSLGDKVIVKTILSATFKTGLLSKIKALYLLGIGFIQSLLILIKVKPQLVVGFGGYPSFPFVLASQLTGVRTILHEQNAILGKANKYLAPMADRIAASMPNTKGIAAHEKVVETGNPTRAAICEVREHPYPKFDEELNVFITGGSQAAKILGDVLPHAFAMLDAEIRNKLKIVQQCKPENVEEISDIYKAAEIKSEVKSFFDDMPDRLSACHLFIGRSGASTVTEIALVGRPAIFIPLMHADRQQYLNADALVECDAAWIIEEKEFTPKFVKQQIELLVEDTRILEIAAKAAKECGKPNAVQRLADLVEKRI